MHHIKYSTHWLMMNIFFYQSRIFDDGKHTCMFTRQWHYLTKKTRFKYQNIMETKNVKKTF